MPQAKFQQNYGSDWANAWNAFVSLISTDPELNAAGCKIAYFGTSETPTALAKTENPNPAQLPLVRLTALPSPSQWETEGQHRAPLAIEVEIAIEGWSTASFLQLWGAIIMAVYPDSSNTERIAAKVRLMNDARINQITMTGIPGPQPSGHGLRGAGTFLIDIYTSTSE